MESSSVQLLTAEATTWSSLHFLSTSSSTRITLATSYSSRRGTGNVAELLCTELQAAYTQPIAIDYILVFSPVDQILV